MSTMGCCPASKFARIRPGPAPIMRMMCRRDTKIADIPLVPLSQHCRSTGFRCTEAIDSTGAGERPAEPEGPQHRAAVWLLAANHLMQKHAEAAHVQLSASSSAAYRTQSAGRSYMPHAKSNAPHRMCFMCCAILHNSLSTTLAARCIYQRLPGRVPDWQTLESARRSPEYIERPGAPKVFKKLALQLRCHVSGRPCAPY